MTFADKMIELRRKNSLSQEALAEKLDISRQAVSRWETGAAMPDAQNLLQMSKLFGVTTDFLLNDEYQSDMDIPIVCAAEKTLQKAHKRSDKQYYTNAMLISAAIVTLYAFIIFTSGGCLEGNAVFTIPLLTPLPLLYLAIFRHELLTQKSVLIISMITTAAVITVSFIGVWVNLNYFYSESQYLLIWAYIIEFFSASSFCVLSCFIPFLSVKRKWWMYSIIYVSSALITFSLYYVCSILSDALGAILYWTPHSVPVIIMLISQTAFIIAWYFYYSERKQKDEKM